MITVEQMADMVSDETMDSMKYLKCAMKCREDDPDMAKMFFALSDDEMRHMKMLHEKLRSMEKSA